MGVGSKQRRQQNVRRQGSLKSSPIPGRRHLLSYSFSSPETEESHIGYNLISWFTIFFKDEIELMLIWNSYLCQLLS